MVYAGILAVLGPSLIGSPAAIDVVEPANATPDSTHWSTVHALEGDRSFFSGAAVFHRGEAWLFDSKTNSHGAVYRFEPPQRLTEAFLYPMPSQVQSDVLAVSHREFIYLFGSDRIDSSPCCNVGGEVLRVDPIVQETTVVAFDVFVGKDAAGVSVGEFIYIFPGNSPGFSQSDKIWRFDPSDGSFVNTGVRVPYWDGVGDDRHAREATALWTGSEIVLLGGIRQQGRITTWVPGDSEMGVLPFVMNDGTAPRDGHAIWTGASIYVLGDGGTQRVDRITIHPTEFQENVDLGLVHPVDQGDAVWDGQDAYIFRRDDVIRFHPWESDLPRFTLGQDFSVDQLDYKVGHVSDTILCRATAAASVGGSVSVANDIWDAIFNPHPSYDTDFCVKGLLETEFSFAYWPGVDGVPGDGPGQIYGLAAAAFVLIPGGPVLSLKDAGITLAQGVLTALPNLVGALETNDKMTYLRHGGIFVVERGCSEQIDSVDAEVTFDYLAAGRVRSALAGQASAWSVLGIKGQPQQFLGQSPHLPEIHLNSVSSAVSPQWWPPFEVDESRFEYDFDETTVFRDMGAGYSLAYGAIVGTQIAQAGVGTSVSAFDAANDGDGFELLEIRYEFDDQSPPSISWEADGPAGREGWFTGDVVVRAIAGDSETCVEELVVDGPPPVQARVQDPWNPMIDVTWDRQGTSGFTATATNHKGLSGLDSRSIAIDGVALDSSHSLSGIGQNGWYRSCVDLTITTIDSTSGPAEQFSDRPGDGELEAASREFCAEGIEPFTYWGWDVAGNVEEANDGPVLKIDRTPPDGGVGSYDGLEGYEDWYQSCVLVPVLGWDALSGFDVAEYAINDGEFTEGDEAEVCDEGFNEVHVIAHDVAGNEDIQRSFEVKVDDTDPEVATSVPLLTVLGDPAQVSYDADDDLSGLYGTIGVEMRYEPLVGEPTSFQRVCTDEAYEFMHSGSCEVPLEELGNYCFRTWVGDRARNVGVSDVECTTYVGL